MELPELAQATLPLVVRQIRNSNDRICTLNKAAAVALPPTIVWCWKRAKWGMLDQETVTRLLTHIHDWGEDLTIRHLVMPDHVECCTYPVIDWLAENMLAAPVNIMYQYRPENFCDLHGGKYRERYAALPRRPTGEEIRLAYAHARKRGVNFEASTYEKTRRGLFA
jgi:hypothetical protein